jgi:hypothetical protein
MNQKNKQSNLTILKECVFFIFLVTKQFSHNMILNLKT